MFILDDYQGDLGRNLLVERTTDADYSPEYTADPDAIRTDVCPGTSAVGSFSSSKDSRACCRLSHCRAVAGVGRYVDCDNVCRCAGVADAGT